MFVISTEQMSLFKEAALRSFQNKMLDHLRDFSPLLFEAVGEEQMGKAIQFGIDQAGVMALIFVDQSSFIWS